MTLPERKRHRHAVSHPGDGHTPCPECFRGKCRYRRMAALMGTDGHAPLGKNGFPPGWQLMRYLPVPAFVIDSDGKILIWNQACEHLTGVAAANVIGTRNHWQAFYSEPQPCLADALVQGRSDELSTLFPFPLGRSEFGQGIRAEIYCLMPKIGKRLYLTIEAVPIQAEDGQLIAVVETLRDMTEYKKAQMILQERATHDCLTGIANRRSFDEKLHREWKRARRQQATLSLIMIDVDHFKPYNDLYGHQSGDECLKTVSAILQSQVFRAGDLVARYGGEEFAVILPGTDLSDAHEVAERIRCCIEQAALPHAASAPHCRVTVSIGIAALTPTPGLQATTLIALADQALYSAKRGGRNQVCVATEPGAAA